MYRRYKYDASKPHYSREKYYNIKNDTYFPCFLRGIFDYYGDAILAGKLSQDLFSIKRNTYVEIHKLGENVFRIFTAEGFFVDVEYQNYK